MNENKEKMVQVAGLRKWYGKVAARNNKGIGLLIFEAKNKAFIQIIGRQRTKKPMKYTDVSRITRQF